MVRFILIAWLALCGTANAQLSGGLQFPGPGTAHSSATYTGPGDVKSGATVFHSCARAYNAAWAAVTGKACQICNVADVACTDVTVGTNGKVTMPLIGGSDCSVVTCTIKIMYDQSGANACSGGACDQTVSTIADRMTLVVNALGSLPCGTAGGTSQGSTRASFTGPAHPYSVSAVVAYTSGSSTSFFGGGSGGGVGFGTVGTNWGFYASANATNSVAADTSFHALQMNANGASSSIYLDGSGTTGLSSGSASLTTTVALLRDIFGNPWRGKWCETGIYPLLSAGDSASMNTNQHSAADGYNF
jgi:hypothetical protein